MRKLILILFCFPLLMAATCEDDDDTIAADCSGEAVAGLNVKVRDVSTGDYLSDGVQITAQDGTYSELLQLVPDSNPPLFAGAWERTGTYTLTVQKSGYATTITNAYPVTANSCHVITRNVTVDLSPQ